jgi:HlyD family secretion protein
MTFPELAAGVGRALIATRTRRIALGVVALLVALLAVRALRGREVPAYLVESRPLVQKVVATGRVRPLARISLASLTIGRIRTVLVKEGDRVAGGQLLLKIEDVELAATLRQAQGRVAEAAARLEQVRGLAGRQAAEALHQAEVRVAQAEQDQARARQLAEAGSSPRQAADDAERTLALARSQREAAAAQVASAGGADERLAGAALAQAEAARAVVASRLAETEIRAPAPGLVVAREVEPGDVVQPGKALLGMTADGPVELTAQVDEKNLSLLRLGQPARASADAFPGQVFDAAVALIAPAVDASRGTVEVRLAVAAPPAVLRADMTVSVNVDVARKAQALVIPADVIRDPTGEPWVLAILGGRAERRPVTLGMRGDGLVEITGGLAAGDAVVALTAGFVAAGERVRARPIPAPVLGASHAL